MPFGSIGLEVGHSWAQDQTHIVREHFVWTLSWKSLGDRDGAGEPRTLWLQLGSLREQTMRRPNFDLTCKGLHSHSKFGTKWNKMNSPCFLVKLARLVRLYQVLGFWMFALTCARLREFGEDLHSLAHSFRPELDFPREEIMQCRRVYSQMLHCSRRGYRGAIGPWHGSEGIPSSAFLQMTKIKILHIMKFSGFRSHAGRQKDTQIIIWFEKFKLLSWWPTAQGWSWLGASESPIPLFVVNQQIRHVQLLPPERSHRWTKPKAWRLHFTHVCIQCCALRFDHSLRISCFDTETVFGWHVRHANFGAVFHGHYDRVPRSKIASIIWEVTLQTGQCCKVVAAKPKLFLTAAVRIPRMSWVKISGL